MSGPCEKCGLAPLSDWVTVVVMLLCASAVLGYFVGWTRGYMDAAMRHAPIEGAAR